MPNLKTTYLELHAERFFCFSFFSLLFSFRHRLGDYAYTRQLPQLERLVSEMTY